MKNTQEIIQNLKRFIAKKYLELFRRKDYQNLVKSFSIINLSNGKIVASKDGDKTLPIGSITKLMTSYMILDTVDDLESLIFTVRDEDIYDPVKFSTAYLKAGEKKTAIELLEETLIVSACDSANLLGSHQVNDLKLNQMLEDYILDLNLNNSKLVDTTGESMENKMSANDINLLTKELIEKYPQILEILRKNYIERAGKRYSSTFPKVKKGNGNKIIGVKTGYLREAGRSFVFLLETDKNEKYLISLIGAGRLIERDFFIEKLLKEYLDIIISFKI